MKVLKENGLKIVDFPDREQIEIAGTLYSYDLFRCWGNDGMKVDTKFKIVDRSDKSFTVEEIK